MTEWQKAGLPKASLIRPVLTTIEKRLILRKLGELQDPDRTALRTALAAILG
jgi:mRNA interferase MazF